MYLSIWKKQTNKNIARVKQNLLRLHSHVKGLQLFCGVSVTIRWCSMLIEGYTEYSWYKCLRCCYLTHLTNKNPTCFGFSKSSLSSFLHSVFNVCVLYCRWWRPTWLHLIVTGSWLMRWVLLEDNQCISCSPYCPLLSRITLKVGIASLFPWHHKINQNALKGNYL